MSWNYLPLIYRFEIRWIYKICLKCMQDLYESMLKSILVCSDWGEEVWSSQAINGWFSWCGDWTVIAESSVVTLNGSLSSECRDQLTIILQSSDFTRWARVNIEIQAFRVFSGTRELRWT